MGVFSELIRNIHIIYIHITILHIYYIAYIYYIPMNPMCNSSQLFSTLDIRYGIEIR